MKIVCTKCGIIIGEWDKPSMTEQDLADAREMFKCDCEPEQNTVELIEE
jgi:hypothetical protein